MTVPNENSVEPTSHAIPRDEPQSQSSLRPSLSLTNEVLVPRQVPGSYSAQVVWVSQPEEIQRGDGHPFFPN